MTDRNIAQILIKFEPEEEAGDQESNANVKTDAADYLQPEAWDWWTGVAGSWLADRDIAQILTKFGREEEALDQESKANKKTDAADYLQPEAGDWWTGVVSSWLTATLHRSWLSLDQKKKLLTKWE